jgi:hypothetical protein
VKLRNDAKALRRKALSSMRSATAAFNSPDDDGRPTAVLLHLQHSFEMLLKAALVQGGVRVFDKQSGRSISFEQAVRQAAQAPRIKLSDEEAGTLRAVDAMRDDEQHWFTHVDEGLLYLHTRAAVTLFDDLLHRAFGERLADHLPLRVLPVGTEPPQDFQTLVDREYARIAELLKPHRRARAQARARLRALLAMEAHVRPDARVSVTDVNRVEKGVRAGKTREQVFPPLGRVAATVSGEGLSVEVRFVKKGGLAVRLVKDDEAVDAAAFRTVDLQRKFHRSAAGLAQAVGLTGPKATALRAHLGIDDDDDCQHVFEFGKARHARYSDNAYARMRDALAAGTDMAAVWTAHRPGGRGARRPCGQPGCAAPASPSATRAS